MANEEQLEILKSGSNAWSKWRDANPNISIDLTEANLHGANLVQADLVAANLKEADLSNANLHNALLYQANLSRANLRKANLKDAQIRAILVNTDCSEADLRKSDLVRATLIETNLHDADLGNATVGATMFGKIDLSTTKGLETIVHWAPSFISLDTIKLSKGKIPLAFLRGCGLTDLEIEFAKLAAPGLDPEQVTDITYKIHQFYLGRGIQYYSCFISYNNQDEVFAKLLHDDLQNNGVRCWFAPEDMKIGDQMRPRIDQEIRLRDKLLVILSENSVQSEWVGDEVEAALEEEGKSNRLVLFPIRLDDAVMSTRDDWAAKIKRRRHIGDFSNWKDKASYQKAFERLLRDLKAEADNPVSQ